MSEARNSSSSVAAARGWREGGWRWRVPALLVSLAFIAATVWPALRDPPEDSFPLSTYPMFSEIRKTAWLHVVVGYDADEEEHKIPPVLVANVEVMQASETIRHAVRRRRAEHLCAAIAERVAQLDEDDELDTVVRLEVQSRRFNPYTYFVEPEGDEPLRLRHRARCPVPGRAAQEEPPS